MIPDLHRPILKECLLTLEQIFFAEAHAGPYVDKQLKYQKKWGARDRRAFAETVYDVVRWWRRLTCLAGFDFNRLSGPEILPQIVDLYFQHRKNPDQFADKIFHMSRAERESVPDWLDSLGSELLGDGWPQVLTKLNEQAPQYLRANRLRISPVLLQELLAKESVSTSQVIDHADALRLDVRKNVFITSAFKNGYFEMQDAGSQLIAPFTQCRPGERIVDACAGAGGKSLHMAALMENKGQILSLDIHDWKLKELKLRARRAHVSIVETRLIQNTKVIKRLAASADRVLLDVPCSGLGVLRRHPDTKWKLSMQQLRSLEKTQADILRNYSSMVKPGGNLIYATCSVLPTENETQIRNFLTAGDNSWTLEDEIHVLPHQYDSDGYYAARLKRKL